MRLLSRFARLALVAVWATAGCQKSANRMPVDEAIDVPSLGIKSKIIDAPKKDQKVAITAQAGGGNFNIYVVLQKEMQSVVGQLENQESVGANVLAKKEKTKDVALDVTIPAGQGFAVILSNAGPKDLSIKLKVSNVP